ncbi:DUF3329 domain-containing protein [Amaricoccus tamworthensis]|uniref:DUF3329 domain-containing protein n=1 Tax=Amaricoccus tamworthensis TaxID=57002 RepID=UPI003C7C0D98
MKIIDADHPAYRPLWVRIVIVGFSALWALFEFWHGNAVWGAVFLGIAALATWKLFITWRPKDPD